MADVNIPSTPAEGNVKSVYVPPVADMTAPTLTEANAATAADLSCYHTAGGFAFAGDQATMTDERECSTTTSNKPGRKSYTLSITAIDNTNNSALEAEFNLAVDTLVEGQTLDVIRRRGKAFDAPLTAGDKVKVIRFEVGQRVEVPVEPNSVQRSTWSCFVNNAVDGVIAAAL